MRPRRLDLRDATENLGKRADLELMLSVIRDAEPEARAAYALWRERYPVDDMDIHAMKLVPRLGARLKELGVVDEETARLLGITRYLWTQGEVMMAGARQAAEALRPHGMTVIAIKGVALRHRGLVRPHERPMVDADLVLEDEFKNHDNAVQILRKRGWRLGSRLAHATTMKSGKAEIDLHRVAVRQDRRFNVADWSGHEREPFGVLGVTGSLILTCLHGMRTDGGALWVLDAEALVKTGDINWEAVYSYAKRRVLVLTLATALRRVRGVPEHVLAILDDEQATHIEALELHHLAVKFDRHGALAARLLERLRAGADSIDVRSHEDAPGMRWDPRWVKEWR